jgi:perosamine synthetase
MKIRVSDLVGRFSKACQVPYFGFVYGHSHLAEEDLATIHELLGVEAPDVVVEFEQAFAALVGEGEAISYAAGRMAFYDLLHNIGVGEGDEVILLGATCAVMVNAVIRTGATPVFSDIDPDTFGSSAISIERCLSPRSRVIVAQHSLGIPCDILPIVELAKSQGIFLVEDCALTLGSTIDGIAVGNFGDVAIFSVDHGKPINCMTGGLAYMRDRELASRLRNSRDRYANLPSQKQQMLWKQLQYERKYFVPDRYGRIGLLNIVSSVQKRLIKCEDPFLSDDFDLPRRSHYPYPARLPAFLAKLGIIEIKRWPSVAAQKEAFLERLIDVASHELNGFPLPSAYRNGRTKIVPLRFVWFQEDADRVCQSLSTLVETSGTFFRQPIVATSTSLEDFGYRYGSCPLTEKIGRIMINIPCPATSDKDLDMLVSIFRKACLR